LALLKSKSYFSTHLRAGHASAVVAARVMRSQSRAIATIKTCSSCVAAGQHSSEQHVCTNT
jgi:hypothetical protein